MSWLVNLQTTQELELQTAIAAVKGQAQQQVTDRVCSLWVISANGQMTRGLRRHFFKEG